MQQRNSSGLVRPDSGNGPPPKQDATREPTVHCGPPMAASLPRARVRSIALGVCLFGGAACRQDTAIESRAIVVISPRSCPIAQNDAYSVIYGYGDFRDEKVGVSSLYLRDVGKELAELPTNARSVIVDVSYPSQREEWRGISEISSSGPVNVLVWPPDKTCSLTTDVEPRIDMTFGVFGRHVMVAGGSLPGRVPQTFVGDLSTAIITPLSFGLGLRRSNATLTTFGISAPSEPALALVAGGENPDSHEALATAEVYAPNGAGTGTVGDFETERIELSEPRTKHGAVTLATGETLLVGGVGPLGNLLTTMEVIDPKTRRQRSSGVALLAVPRTRPTVLRLASGEILVAGGFDSEDKPVPTLEWFSPDASRQTKRPADLVAGRERAFVPLEAGGALAVVIPSSAVAAFNTVWIISADGALEPGVSIDPKSLDKVVLFRGTEGAPVLWTGHAWLRFQPWSASFQPILDAPANGPSVSSIANGDDGLALWLDNSVAGQLHVAGYRFATRSRYGVVRTPLLMDGPAGLAPDRIARGSLRFDATKGLQLAAGASAFVTDVSYAGVDVDLEFSGTTVVVLRQEDGRELEVGGAECPSSVRDGTSIRIEREGSEVRFRIDDGESQRCGAELSSESRVKIGVRGGESGGFARNLRITRR